MARLRDLLPKTMKDRRLDAPEIKNNHCGTIKPTIIVAENIFEDQETAFINARFGDNPQFPLKPEYVHLRLTHVERMEIKELPTRLRIEAISKLSNVKITDLVTN